MSFMLVHTASSASTMFNLKKNDLVVMTKTGCTALSNALTIGEISSPNGRGVMNSGNDYTTYTCRNFYCLNDDIGNATISTPSSSYTSYYIFVFRPLPGYKFLGTLTMDSIDPKIYPGSKTYVFNTLQAPMLSLVSLTIGWAPNTSSSVTGGTAINGRAAYAINSPATTFTARLSSSASYERWGSVGLAFPLMKTVQAQAQIIG